MSSSKKATPLMWAFAALCAVALLLTGCKAEECQQMTECCAAVADVPGVGSSCGELAEQTRDPETCRTILRTVRYMYEDREGDAPAICQRKSSVHEEK